MDLDKIKYINNYREELKRILAGHSLRSGNPNIEKEVTPRNYQAEAGRALSRAREEGSKRALIELATGLGKTNISVWDYATYRHDRLQKGERAKGLFVVHQTNIRDQAKERFEGFLPDLELVNSDFEGNIVPDADMVFTTFQTLYNRELSEDAFDYIVYDEAHHIGAETYKEVVDGFRPDFQLGLTATPERMDEKDIFDHFGKPVYKKNLAQALGEGYLAKVDYNIVSDEEFRKRVSDGFYATSVKEINALFEIEPRNEEIIRIIQEKQEEIKEKEGLKNVKTIVFCNSVEHADKTAELLNGISYHSKWDEKFKDDVMNSFKYGSLDTITVVDMFNEGVDIPDARMVVFLRSTQSKTIFEQQLGRGLRKNEKKNTVTALDFVANIDRVAMVRDLVKEIKRARGESNQDGDLDGVYVDDIDEYTENVFEVSGSDFIFDEEIISVLERYYGIRKKLDERPDFVNMTNEEISELARRISPNQPILVEEIRQLSKENRFLSLATLKAKFGSTIEFQKQTWPEHDFRLDFANMTNERISELARQLSPDKPLFTREMNEFSKAGKLPSVGTIIDHFGGILEFQKQTWPEHDFGPERPDFAKMTNERISELARQLSPDKPLTTREIREFSRVGKLPSTTTIADRFGSFSEFQKQTWPELFK